MEKFYMPTAIAYTSGQPHRGNTYEIVLADAIARYKRLRGFDVYFMTGTDEHGEKIEKKAQEQNITPKEFVDGVSSEIRKIWDLVGASYDKFIRTTDEDHVELIKKIFMTEILQYHRKIIIIMILLLLNHIKKRVNIKQKLIIETLQNKIIIVKCVLYLFSSFFHII